MNGYFEPDLEIPVLEPDETEVAPLTITVTRALLCLFGLGFALDIATFAAMVIAAQPFLGEQTLKVVEANTLVYEIYTRGGWAAVLAAKVGVAAFALTAAYFQRYTLARSAVLVMGFAIGVLGAFTNILVALALASVV